MTKEINVVSNHAIMEIWEDVSAIKLHTLLGSMEAKWTSTDIVRIGIREEPSSVFSPNPLDRCDAQRTHRDDTQYIEDKNLSRYQSWAVASSERMCNA